MSGSPAGSRVDGRAFGRLAGVDVAAAVAGWTGGDDDVVSLGYVPE